MFAEMMPTVRWKASRISNQRILLEQGNLLRFVYYFAVFCFSALNLCKGIMFFMFILSSDIEGEFMSYFLSIDSRGNPKQAKREGGFTLLAESFLILINIYIIQMYRPIVLTAKDAIFYREQMVHNE